MAAPHYHSHVDDPVAVGKRLKEARLAAGFSQRQLSFPGCSAASISRLEAGDRVPSTGVERVEQDPPELVEAEVERRLGGGTREGRNSRPSEGLGDPRSRARVLWTHSRELARSGDKRAAARYARDALALLDYADDVSLDGA